MKSTWGKAAMPAALVVTAVIWAASTTTAMGDDPLPSVATELPAWVRRGDEVEASSRKYDVQLQRLYDDLSAVVQIEAPDLFPKLQKSPPKPDVYGYGLLPTLTAPTAEVPVRSDPPQSSRYSWPWTGRKISNATTALESLRAQIEQARGLSASARRDALGRIVDEFEKLTEAQQNIADHLRYNRLWQAEIAIRRAKYERGTLFHDKAVELHAIRRALTLHDQAAFESALAPVPGLVFTGPREPLLRELRARESLLDRQIREELDRIDVPRYVQVLEREPRNWLVRVRVYTDIDDEAFLAEFRRVVEETWRLREGGVGFAVEVSILRVDIDALYRLRPGCEDGAAPGCAMPRKGEHIDLLAHAARFPTDGARLTSGAGTTHVDQGIIFLGSGSMSPRVLAHEFGHLLGFRDEYFRGYRDLGADGFEVVEIVADPAHLMGNPEHGTVTRRYFDRLLAARKQYRGA